MGRTTDWLDTVLAPLRDPHRAHAWPSAEDVAARAARRRRLRRTGLASGATALAVAGALVAAVVVIPGAGSPARGRTSHAAGAAVRTVPGPGGSIRLVASERRTGAAGPARTSELASAEQAFALDLTRAELSSSPGADVLVSPLSADVDLSMLELAAGGRTEEDIAAALHSSGLTAPQNAAAWHALASSELAGGTPGELSLANSLWLEQHLHVEAAFLQAQAAAFGNQTYEVDFHSPSATNAINTWVDRATSGRIPELFSPGELSSQTLVVLANALHLHAAWADPHQFTPSTGTFTTSGGQALTVPTLSAPGAQVDFSSTPAYDAVQIPYTNGRFAALVVQPRSTTLASWLTGLGARGLARIVASLSPGTVHLTMPALDLAQRPALNAALSKMGMGSAFFSADLVPMLGPTLGQRVAVAQVQQAVTLQVNRWGTDAAAATGISVVPSAAERTHDIAIDHPYLFLVRDTQTGAILFSSAVMNPLGT